MTPDLAVARRGRSHVVIIGCGFGGLYAARALRGAPVTVTVVDRTNHHLFQPLLYQVATATLSPADIAQPIRFLLRNQPNTAVIMDDVERVDPDRRVVHLTEGGALSYDYLIVAAGARHSYFGNDGWEAAAPGLKTLDDALEIRQRFLIAFEKAEQCTDADERQAWLTFVVVGGGPTGVELAGIMPGIARQGMRGEFRNADPADIRVVLVEAGPRVLPAFSDRSSARARADLKALGVDVRVNTMVTGIDASGVRMGEEFLAARTVFWGAGNAASPLARSLGAPLDKAGRVRVNADLSVPGHAEVLVVGDLAAVEQKNGELVPGVAPAAMQQGRWAARNVIRAVRGRQTLPFRYINKGDLATIGRERAVAEFANGRLKFGGRLAWLLWLFIHIMYLAGFRNRVIVLLEWAYAYVTYRRGARIIRSSEAGPSASPAREAGNRTQ